MKFLVPLSIVAMISVVLLHTGLSESKDPQKLEEYSKINDHLGEASPSPRALSPLEIVSETQADLSKRKNTKTKLKKKIESLKTSEKLEESTLKVASEQKEVQPLLEEEVVQVEPDRGDTTQVGLVRDEQDSPNFSMINMKIASDAHKESPEQMDHRSEFSQKWLPTHSDFSVYSESDRDQQDCRTQICQDDGDQGVLLTGLVVSSDVFTGRLHSGSYYSGTPLLYIK